MEHSSPLAAMQPPSVMFGHCFRPEPTSYPSCGPRSGIGASPFNFKDLSMKKGGDYFNMKPVRGTSPTASLAADLSQNFHIDQRCVRCFVSFFFFISFLGSFFVCFVSPGQRVDPKNSPQLATPRRSLFSSNLFAQSNGKATQCRMSCLQTVYAYACFYT